MKASEGKHAAEVTSMLRATSAAIISCRTQTGIETSDEQEHASAEQAGHSSTHPDPYQLLLRPPVLPLDRAADDDLPVTTKDSLLKLLQMFWFRKASEQT